MKSDKYPVRTLDEMLQDLHRSSEMTIAALNVGISVALTGCGLWATLRGFYAGLLPVVLGCIWLGWSSRGFLHAQKRTLGDEATAPVGRWIPGARSSNTMRASMTRIAAQDMSAAEAEVLIAVHGTELQRSLWTLLKRTCQ